MEKSDSAFLNRIIYNYKFNGIERTEGLGLMVDLAFYRGLDPVLGKWYQVDPYAESFYTMSPYCSMGNNPISYADPQGGWVNIVVGAGIGAIANVATHWDDVTKNGTGWSWGAFAKAAAIGGAAGAISGATGGAWAAGFGLGTTGIASGLVTGGIGAAYGSIAQGVGNAIAFGDEYSIKRLGIDIVGGALIGGLISGGVAAFKGQNIWWGNTLRHTSAPVGNIGASDEYGMFKGTNSKGQKATVSIEADDVAPSAIQPAGEFDIPAAKLSGMYDGPIAGTILEDAASVYGNLVSQARNLYGGNVTVMKNGVDLFRVHQPSSGHGLKITPIIERITPKGLILGKGKDIPFNEMHIEQLKKALGGLDGFSLRTRGGR